MRSPTSHPYKISSCTVDYHSFLILIDTRMPEGQPGRITTLGLVPFNRTATEADRKGIKAPEEERVGYSRILHTRGLLEYLACFFPTFVTRKNRKYARFIRDELHAFLDYYRCCVEDFPEFESLIQSKIDKATDKEKREKLEQKLVRVREKYQEYKGVLYGYDQGCVLKAIQEEIEGNNDPKKLAQLNGKLAAMKIKYAEYRDDAKYDKPWTAEHVLEQMKTRPYGRDISSVDVELGYIDEEEKGKIITEFERLDAVYRRSKYFTFCYYNCLGTNFRVLENTGIAEGLGLKLSQIATKIVEDKDFAPTQGGHFMARYFRFGYMMHEQMPLLGKFGKGLCFHISSCIVLPWFLALKTATAIIKWLPGIEVSKEPPRALPALLAESNHTSISPSVIQSRSLTPPSQSSGVRSSGITPAELQEAGLIQRSQIGHGPC